MTGILVAALVTVQVGQGVRIARLPAEQIVSWNVVIDDGFYYLQVARNLARGHGSTFDRLNPTNGYQPLWALMLAPIFWFTSDGVTGLRAALILAALLGAASVLLIFVGLRRLAGPGAALLACTLVVANPYFLEIVQGGLETPALLLCMSGLLAFWAHRGERVLAGERRACLGLGLVLGLTVLARTDLALALLPLAIWLLLARAPRGRQDSAGPIRLRLRRALLVALPAMVLLLPFILWSWVTQGSPVPVSGLVKRWVAATFTRAPEAWDATGQWRGLSRTIHLLVWPARLSGEELITDIAPALKLCAALVVVLGLRLVWSRSARGNRPAIILATGAVAGITLHGLYMFYVYRSTGHWNYHYFFPAALLYSLLLASLLPLLWSDLGRLLELTRRASLRTAFTAAGVALCLTAASLLLHRGFVDFGRRYDGLLRPPTESFRKSRWDAAQRMRQSYPSDAVFGAWWAGTLGYLSDRRVVNLDGVVNSGAFFRQVLRTDSVPRYLLEGPVSHLVDFFWHNPMTGPPSWRVFWWEHEKEHVVWRLRPHLKIAAIIPFRGEAAMYFLDISKKEGPR